jgi:MFS family permease
MAATTPPSLSTTDEWTKETTTTLPLTPSNSLTTPQSQAEKTGYRKVDIRLLLWYSFVYLIMRIHVQNVTNSAIMNLETGHGIKAQLGNLDSEQWALVISIFYYPYMFLEPPATLLLKRFSPSKWMARIMITWGIISMCQGAAQNHVGLLACRFFLGAAEAGSVFCMVDVDCDAALICLSVFHSGKADDGPDSTPASSTTFLSGIQAITYHSASPSSTRAECSLARSAVCWRTASVS